VVLVPVAKGSLYTRNALLIEAWEPSKGCKWYKVSKCPKVYDWLFAVLPSNRLWLTKPITNDHPHGTSPTFQVGMGFLPLDGSEWWPMEN
jgi:hypothetical protein